MQNLHEVFSKVNWPLLAEQKEALVAVVMADDITPANVETSQLEGLLCLLDALQDAAERDGFPVVFSTAED